MIECDFGDGNKTHLRHATVGSIVLNKTRDELLLVKRAADSRFEPNKYDVPGGFMDLNETTEQTALRELQEETGYQGKIIDLLCINDNPHISPIQNVEFIYLVEVEQKTSEPDHEINNVQWFTISDLPRKEEFAFSRYNDITLYIEYRKEDFRIPKIISV